MAVAGTQMCQLQRMTPAASFAAITALPGLSVSGVEKSTKPSLTSTEATTLFAVTSSPLFQVSQRTSALAAATASLLLPLTALNL